MNPFVEERLELGLLYGTDGGPGFDVATVATDGGWEFRNLGEAEELGAWTLGDHLATKTEVEYILQFFRARRGKLVGFRWKDQSDYLLAQTTLGTGDDAETEFQLIQIADTGYGDAYSRTISKPVSGSVQVYLDDVEQLTGWSVDTTTGLITFTTAPTLGQVVSATCEFDKPVRFDMDRPPMVFRVKDTNTGEYAYDTGSLPIVELRV